MFFLPMLLLCGCAALQAQQQTSDNTLGLWGEPTATAYTETPRETSAASQSQQTEKSSTEALQATAVSAATPDNSQTMSQAPSQQAPAPQTTVVSVPEAENTPVALPRTVPPEVQPVPDKDEGKLPRTERRRLKNERFMARLDSLVQSHNFRFLPNSMQELPGGWTQLIYNELYFVGIFSDHVEVHMPMIRGNMVEYIEILNFDTFEIQNYQVSKVQYGWNISFNITNSGQHYTVNMMVYTLTGETVLNLLTLSNTIRYVGYIQSLSKD